MPALTGTLVAGLESFLYSVNKDFADTLNAFSLASRLKLTSGTGVNQADILYQKEITLAASGTTTIDMNGATNDALNINMAMLTVVGIWVVNRSSQLVDSVGTLTLGGGTNPITGLFAGAAQTRKLLPGETLMNFCGNVGGLATIVPATGDLINITNSGAGSSTFMFICIGRSV